MEIVGRAPELAGLLCEAFICEGYVHKGELIANANVVYVRFSGIWHRLVIDCGVIIWRPSSSPSGPEMVESEGWEYPHVDVGAVASVIGHCLKEYRMETAAARANVTFFFDNERTITINNENDRSSFRID